MKKILLAFVISSLFSFSANSQDAHRGKPNPRIVKQKEAVGKRYRQVRGEKGKRREDFKANRKEKWKDASPEKREKMKDRREKWKNSSPEERKKMRELHKSRKENRSERREKFEETRSGVRDHRKEHRKQRLGNASLEERALMQKHRETIKSLTPAQKEAVRKEKERHHAIMKKIVGRDAMPKGEMN